MVELNIKDIAKANLDKVVRITYSRAYCKPNNKLTTVIASIREVNEKYGYIEFGHPLNIENNQVEAGAIALYYNYKDSEFESDIIRISLIDEEDFVKWFYKYIEFHNELIKCNKIDVCVEKENVSY